MASLTIRNIDESLKAGLRLATAENGRSKIFPAFAAYIWWIPGLRSKRN